MPRVLGPAAQDLLDGGRDLQGIGLLPHRLALGLVVERLDAGAPVFACLLGGPDGRDLFLSCAPDFDEEARTANAEATIRFVRTDVPHGGQP